MASEAAPVCEVDAVAGHRVGGPRLVTEHQRDHNDLARRYLPTTLNYGRRRQAPAGQFRLDGVLPVLQPVHRGVDVMGGRPGDPEVVLDLAAVAVGAAQVRRGNLGLNGDVASPQMMADAFDGRQVCLSVDTCLKPVCRRRARGHRNFPR